MNRSFIYVLIFRKEVPTTTICFEPFLKQSILKKYNITINDFYFQSEAFGKVTWNQLQDELFYQNTVDFNLTLELLTEPYQTVSGMVEGKNGQSNNETLIILTKLLTFWNGDCYKVTFDYKTFERSPQFWLRFNVSEEDIPKVVLYVTSEENSEGVIFNNWRNGKALKVIPEHTQSYYRHVLSKSFT